MQCNMHEAVKERFESLKVGVCIYSLHTQPEKKTFKKRNISLSVSLVVTFVN